MPGPTYFLPLPNKDVRVTISILQIRKLRYREVKKILHGYKAHSLLSREISSRVQALQPLL